MARRRHSNRRRRRGNFGFLYKLLSVLVICAAVVMALTLFFRGDTIEVTGTERYTEKDKLLSARMHKAITVILFNFLSFWNEYIIAMTRTSGDFQTLPVGLMNLMKAQNASAQYGQMYAGLVIVMLPTLILYIAVQRQLTQGMTVGGIKG